MVFSPAAVDESAKDYWHFKRLASGSSSARSLSPHNRANASSTHYSKPASLRRLSPGNHPRSAPGHTSGSNNSLANGHSHPTTNTSNAAPSAAAAAYQGNRPSLRVFSSYHPESPDNSIDAGSAGSMNSNSASSTSVNSSSYNSASHNTTPKTSMPASSTTSKSLRRLWFRKKSGGSATSLMVTPLELVDDVKLRILGKYPTSLQQHCDPSDLVITVQQHSGIRLELQPDEIMVDVIERYYPEGMRMSDALEIGPESSKWTGNDRDLSTGTAATSPGFAMTSVPSCSNINRNMSQRISLQRSRSYSQSYGGVIPQSHSTHSLVPLPQASVPLSQTAPTTDGQSHTPGRHEWTTPHSPVSDRSQSRASTPSPGPSHHGQQSRRNVINNTSILLLPKQLTSGSKTREQSRSATKLVPLTSERSPDQELDTWLYDANSSAGAVDPAAQELTIQSPTVQVDDQGKPTVVPQINVLIVEDNPVNQRILKRFMHKWQIRFDVASNGREALEKWKAGGFHLILMDIQLPVMTGLEATTEIRRLEKVNGIGAFQQSFKNAPKRLEDIPEHERIKKSAGGFRSPVIIVALTASSDFDDKSEALAAGCNDFLTKPVHFQWLDKKIIEWGCMQALIDFDGWKQWSEERPKLVSRPNSTANVPGVSSNTPMVPEPPLATSSPPLPAKS